MKRRVALALAAAVVTISTTATAQPGAPAPAPPPEEPVPAPPPVPPGPPAPPPGWQPAPLDAAPAPAPLRFKRTKRYPLKVLAADAASMAAIVIGATLVVGEGLDNDSDDPDGAGMVLLVGGALGLFLGSPLVHLSEDNSSSAWKALGVRLGVPLAMSLLASGADSGSPDEETMDSLAGLVFLGVLVFDYAVLAKVEIKGDFAVSPYAAPTAQGGMTMGLGGRF